MLTGHVAGTSSTPYAVSVIFSPQERADGRAALLATSCTCPMRAACKHVAALLYAAAAAPRAREPAPPAETPSPWLAQLTPVTRPTSTHPLGRTRPRARPPAARPAAAAADPLRRGHAGTGPARPPRRHGQSGSLGAGRPHLDGPGAHARRRHPEPAQRPPPARRPAPVRLPLRHPRRLAAPRAHQRPAAVGRAGADRRGGCPDHPRRPRADAGDAPARARRDGHRHQPARRRPARHRPDRRRRRDPHRRAGSASSAGPRTASSPGTWNPTTPAAQPTRLRLARLAEPLDHALADPRRPAPRADPRAATPTRSRTTSCPPFAPSTRSRSRDGSFETARAAATRARAAPAALRPGADRGSPGAGATRCRAADPPARSAVPLRSGRDESRRSGAMRRPRTRSSPACDWLVDGLPAPRARPRPRGHRLASIGVLVGLPMLAFARDALPRARAGRPHPRHRQRQSHRLPRGHRGPRDHRDRDARASRPGTGWTCRSPWPSTARTCRSTSSCGRWPPSRSCSSSRAARTCASTSPSCSSCAA